MVFLFLFYGSLFLNVAQSLCPVCNQVAVDCKNGSLREPVCDESYNAIQPDLFCDDDCACGDGFDCVNLKLRCNMVQDKVGSRCISQKSLDYRYELCKELIPNAPNDRNIKADWIFFDNPNKCISEDCLITRKLLVESGDEYFLCAHVITAWKENGDYHFIMDGSMSSEAKGGEYHIKIPASSISNSNIDFKGLSRSIIQNCYNLQTRNDPKRKCIGKYYVHDALKSVQTSVDMSFSQLKSPVVAAIVGSVLVAFVMLAAVLVVRKRVQSIEVDEEPKDPDDINSPINSRHSKGSLRHRSTPPVPDIQSPI